jgi:hypothetical protein
MGLPPSISLITQTGYDKPYSALHVVDGDETNIFQYNAVSV